MPHPICRPVHRSFFTSRLPRAASDHDVQRYLYSYSGHRSDYENERVAKRFLSLLRVTDRSPCLTVCMRTPFCAYGSGTYQPRIARTILLARSPASLFLHRADRNGSPSSASMFHALASLPLRHCVHCREIEGIGFTAKHSHDARHVEQGRSGERLQCGRAKLSLPMLDQQTGASVDHSVYCSAGHP